MAQRKKADTGTDLTVKDLTDRLLGIQKDMEKLDNERAHILDQIKKLEATKVLEELAFDKIIQFQRKKQATYGRVTGMFKDAVLVTLTDIKGNVLVKPEGVKRFVTEARVELGEIEKIF